MGNAKRCPPSPQPSPSIETMSTNRTSKSSRCNGQSGALIFYFRFGPPFSTAIFASASRTSRRNKPIDRGSRGCSSRHRRCSRRLNTPANLSVPFSTGSGDAFPGLNSYGPTLATTPIRSKTPSLDRRGSGSKSSSARSTSKVSSCRPVDGSSSELFLVRSHNRRLAKDYENLSDTLAALVTLAAIQFTIRRLTRLAF